MKRNFSLVIMNNGRTELGEVPDEDATTNYNTRWTNVEVTGSDGSVALASVARQKNSYMVDLISSNKYPTFGKAGVTHVVKTDTKTIKGTKVVDNGGGTDPEDPDPEQPKTNYILDVDFIKNVQDVSKNIYGSTESSNYFIRKQTQSGTPIGPVDYVIDPVKGLEIGTGESLTAELQYPTAIFNLMERYTIKFTVSIKDQAAMTDSLLVMYDELAELCLYMTPINGQYMRFSMGKYLYLNVDKDAGAVAMADSYVIELTKVGYAFSVKVNGVLLKFGCGVTAGSFGWKIVFQGGPYLPDSRFSQVPFYLKDLTIDNTDAFDFNYVEPAVKYVFGTIGASKIFHTDLYQAKTSECTSVVNTVDFTNQVVAPIVDVVHFSDNAPSVKKNMYYVAMMGRDHIGVGFTDNFESLNINMSQSLAGTNLLGHRYETNSSSNASGLTYRIFQFTAESQSDAAGLVGVICLTQENDEYWTANYDISRDDIVTRHDSPKSGSYPMAVPSVASTVKVHDDGTVSLWILRCHRMKTGANRIELKSIDVTNGGATVMNDRVLETNYSDTRNYTALAIGFMGTTLYIITGENTSCYPDNVSMIVNAMFYENVTSASYVATTLPNSQIIETNSKYRQCTDYSAFSGSDAAWPEMTYKTVLYSDSICVTSSNNASPVIAHTKGYYSDPSQEPSIYDLNLVYSRTPSGVYNSRAYGGQLFERVGVYYSSYMPAIGNWGGTFGTMVGEWRARAPVSAYSTASGVYYPGHQVAVIPEPQIATLAYCHKIISRTTGTVEA